MESEALKMAQQNEEHFEVISSNKAKAYEEQKEMRQELIKWINSCDKFQMLELYSEMRRMKRSAL
jgi:hypothetical protein